MYSVLLYSKKITFADVYFLGPLAVVSQHQIKKTALIMCIYKGMQKVDLNQKPNKILAK